ncbi:MAG: [Fe-Fe] hydrogenase large subunit C-terminal domain-containing protein [Bacillota bacterium]|jgi:iron only hydrogenase large subunit-like protein/uncharacterized Fe-S cluster-containing protein
MTEFLKLKKSNCKNCYRCIWHCPVKAIRFSGNQAHIISDECILCGQCFVECPQNAKQIVDETEIVEVLLKDSAPVIASVAPSFVAYFDNVGIKSLRKALKELGFADAEETALGATMVKREYEKMTEKNTQDVIITSCCHTVNLLVEKYYPQLTRCLAPVITPMQAHCDDIKRRMPEAKTVFIGPCLSKKAEGYNIGIDAVLTFDELVKMFDSAGIQLDREMDSDEESLARFFPATGGILKTMQNKNPEYTYLDVSGAEKCRAVLDDIAKGNVHKCFVEMSACAGGCIGGPIMEKYYNSPLQHYQTIASYAGKKDFNIAQPQENFLLGEYYPIEVQRKYPTDQEINSILRKMGKYKPSDELNCGSCGYDTCREKAVAIFQGKAEIDMCVPYLMEKSERFSNNIIDNAPSGILVVNEALEVQLINPSAMKMLNVKSRSDVMGEPLVRIMDPLDFIHVRNTGEIVRDKRDYYAEFNKYLEITIVYDQTAGNLICLFRDVSKEEEEIQRQKILGQQTIETADRVVDKQMRIVQEIASLLGETAAETKIALTKLKESVPHEDDE